MRPRCSCRRDACASLPAAAACRSARNTLPACIAIDPAGCCRAARYGRKPLLLLSYSGMAAALAAVATVPLLPGAAGSDCCDRPARGSPGCLSTQLTPVCCYPIAAAAAAAVSPAVSGGLMVCLVLLYVAFFATGSGPVTWVLLSEVLPPAIKGPAASLATAAAWGGAQRTVHTPGCTVLAAPGPAHGTACCRCSVPAAR